MVFKYYVYQNDRDIKDISEIIYNWELYNREHIHKRDMSIQCNLDINVNIIFNDMNARELL